MLVVGRPTLGATPVPFVGGTFLTQGILPLGMHGPYLLLAALHLLKPGEELNSTRG